MATPAKNRRTGPRSSRLPEGRKTPVFDYRLEYAGKLPEAEILRGPRAAAHKALAVRRATGAGPVSRLYCGDNLGVLRALCDDPAVCGQVTLVYIDPPFATGARLAARDAAHAYDDVIGGAQFLEFLRRRLVLLRELLSPAGSVYLHLDGKKAFPMKVLMDEIFGPANFRNWITRKKSNNKNATRRQYGNVTDYILFYTKGPGYVWNRPFDPWDDAHPPKEYQYLEAETGRRYMKVPLHAPGVRAGETGTPWRGMPPPPGKHWQYPPAVLEEMDARGEIYWSPTGNPRRKIYLDQSEGIPAQDLWLQYRDAHNQNVRVTGYPTEKNLELLRRIVQASSRAGDLVLDCFAGSGTTLVAAEDEGRRWIGVDASVTAIDTTLRRLAHGSQPMGDYVHGKSGRKENKPARSPSPQDADFDLYLAEGALPRSPSARRLRDWAGMFSNADGGDQGLCCNSAR